MMNLNMDMAATDSFTSLLGQPMGLREFTPQASMMTTRSSSYAQQQQQQQQQQPQLMELIATDDHQDFKPRAPIKLPNVVTHWKWANELDETKPANDTEASVLPLIDAKLQLVSAAAIDQFLQILRAAKTEPAQALLLVVLRATATSSNAKLAKACAAGFEKYEGLKIAKQWLEDAVEWNYSDLLILLLDVLKHIPLQLTSITEARINEPIVKLRKTARAEKVKKAAQDLLKYWRSTFTEKEKPKLSPAAAAPTAAAAAVPAVSSSTTEQSEKKPVTASSATTATASKPADAAAAKSLKPAPRRGIKRLERLPYGGGSAVSRSSDLIGNLMQRKSAKEAAASSTSGVAKSKQDDSSSDSRSSSSEAAAASGSASSSPTLKSAADEPMLMQLPTIQSFNAATSTASKKIRWADEDGKGELVKIKWIESWRDQIQHNHQEESFRDAKLREHASERSMMKTHKDSESFTVTIAHEWSTPPLVQLPEPLAARRNAPATDEIVVQASRTRREMEYLVLDGEVPAPSPKEWERTNEPNRVQPFEVPLTDLQDTAPEVPPVAPQNMYHAPVETEEEAALRDALGPLAKSTIALLLANEDVLPQVYDEAQRNGNRISDARVMEIVGQRMRMAPQQQRFGGAPSYSKYGGGGGADYGAPGAPFDNHYGQQPPPFEYNRGPSGGMAPHYQQQQAMGRNMPMKRKAPGGGILSDAPPPSKRLNKKGPATQPCMYFHTAAGCKHGTSCLFSHDMAPLGNNEYNYAPMVNGGAGRRFGAGGGGPGRGGNGMRQIRGGR